MNAHVMQELANNLRWINFPNNAQDVLQKLGMIVFFDPKCRFTDL